MPTPNMPTPKMPTPKMPTPKMPTPKMQTPTLVLTLAPFPSMSRLRSETLQSPPSDDARQTSKAFVSQDSLDCRGCSHAS